MSAESHLAVNNGAGNLTGRVEAIDVWIDGDVAARFELRLDAVCKFRQNHYDQKITIGKTTLDYIRYMTCVGNIMWNFYTIKAADLHRLFNDLRDSWDWSLIEAHTEIWDIWESGRDFCPEDFGEQESEAANHATGYRPAWRWRYYLIVAKLHLSTWWFKENFIRCRCILCGKIERILWIRLPHDDEACTRENLPF